MSGLKVAASLGEVELQLDDRGQGASVLLLHGGGGPQTVASFAQLMAARALRVITPVHPGFGGSARPEQLASIPALAEVYAALLDTLNLTDVTVIGNSIGGWIAAELALLGSERLRQLYLVDAVGIEVDGHPVANVFELHPDELTALSFHDPARFRVDLARTGEAQRAVQAGNRAALATYGGSMMDPGLRARLAKLSLPTTVIWGEADRIVDSEYGRSYAAAIRGARFVLLPRAGHLPQLEAPDQLLAAIDLST